MGKSRVKRFVGPDDLVYPAVEMTGLKNAQSVPLDALGVINTAPAWLTGAERLLLFSLVYSLRPQRYLEIGVLHGGASLIASAAMDASGHDGKLILVDREPALASGLWETIRKRSVLLKGYSPGILAEAREAAGGPFDFVFIDAGHTTEAVIRDAEGVLPHLEDGAYLLFHDGYRPEVCRGIDLVVQGRPSSLVDFGLLTREFMTTESGNPGKPGSQRASCGFRMVQLRKRHGRRRITSRWQGFRDRSRRWARRIIRRSLRRSAP
jgi:hypothetical protein